jgi:hypothetical protein
VPELEADWFEELAPLFDEGFRATPEPMDLRAPVGKALPYYMPSAQPTASPTPRRPTPGREPRDTDSLPDYIDRASLSQEGREVELLGAPDPPPEGPTSSTLSPLPWAAAAAAVAAGLPAFVLFVAFLFTAVGLQRSSTDAQQTEVAYYELLDTESGLINDLVALGAPRASLDGPYFAYQDATDPAAREAAADALVDALQDASRRLASTGSARAATTQAQVDRLVRAREAHQDAEASWEGHASTFRGRLLQGVGIGTR